jgi:hypothetical protein
VAFCILAVATFATHKNWKADAIALKAKLEASQQQLKERDAELLNSKSELAVEQAARRAALATLQAKLQLQLADLIKINEELRGKNSSLTEQTQAAKIAEETLASITAEVTKLRNDIRLAQQDRDEQYLKAVALVDKLNQAESLRERLAEQNRQLQDDYARLSNVAQKKGFDARTLVSQIPPPLDGKVTGVDEAKGLVQISLGADDGLKRGHTLQVFRGTQYLGEIILREVDADKSVGDINKKLQRGRIKKDDNVTTKLS